LESIVEGDTVNLLGWWDLIKAGLLAAWLVAAVFWAVAGIAAASWARMSPMVGGLIGGATLFLGCAGILIYGAARKSGAVPTEHATPGLSSPRPHDPRFGDPGGRGNDMGDGTGGFGTPGSTTGFGTPGATGGFGTPGATGGFGTPGATGGFGTPGATGGFGAPGSTTGFGTGGFDTPAVHSSEFTGGGAVPPATNSGPFRAIILTGAAVVGAVYLSAAFTPWVSFGFGLEIDGSEVALVPLMCTVVAVAVCAGFCWQGPRRLPAVVIAWFSSWWMLLGILALSEGGYVADTISSLSARAVATLQLDEQYAQTASVTLGIGVSLVALGGLAGLAWAIVAVLRRAAGGTQWSG